MINELLRQHLDYGTGMWGDVTYPSFTGRVVAKTTTLGRGAQRRYDYTYSPLGFLERADYSSYSDPSADYSASYTYDRQANILSATRKGISLDGGMTTGDHIYYTYRGNQLIKARLGQDVTHVPLEPWIELSSDSESDWSLSPIITLTPWALSGEDYGYDPNGNLIYDRHRKITSINYNAIDRPAQIRFLQGDTLSYIYTATGEKLAEISRSADGLSDLRRDYYGPFEFTGGSLDRTNYPQGYMDYYGYFYAYIPDYQGNILGIYNAATGMLDQFTDYYPYGQPHPDSTSPQLNRRKFGAKELTTSFGLNEYDFAARRLSLNSAFTQPDPLATKYPSISPYSYCAGDPINLIDPTGMEFTDDAEMWAKRMVKYSNGKITENNRKSYMMTQQVLSGKLKIAEIQQITAMQRQLHEENKELSAAQSEIKELRESTQVYDVIVSDKGGPGVGSTEYNIENGNVEMFVPNSDGLELVAHEFKHAHQFETGEYGPYNGMFKGDKQIYDYSDEVAAYKRSDIFSNSSGDNSVPSVYDFLPKENRSVAITFPAESLNSPIHLQRIANQNGLVFRYNGRTYVGRNFKKANVTD